MGRAPCCDKANVKRGPWSPDEDAILKAYIDNHGTGGNWITLPQRAGLRRCGKSCRLRWLNYLRPDIKHGCYTEEEDNIICSLYLSIGSRWSVIASNLQGRTDNDVKNYWNTKLKKKLMAAGTIPDPTEVINIHNTLTRDNNYDQITYSANLCAKRSTALPRSQYRLSSQSYPETNFVSSSPSIPGLVEVPDPTINYIASGNMDFQALSSQEHSGSSGSSSSVMTKQSYCNLSIDDLLDLDFGTVYEILSSGISFDQVTSSNHHSQYMIN